MASKSTNKTTGDITFLVCINRRRRCIWVGKHLDQASVDHLFFHLCELEQAIRVGRQPHSDTLNAVHRMDIDWQEKFAKAGLIAAPKRCTALGQAIELFQEQGANVSEGTQLSRASALKNLVDFFSGELHVSQITPAKASEFMRWLRDEQCLGAMTIRRRVSEIKRVFRGFVEMKIIDSSPVEHLRPARGKAIGYQYIPDETIDRLLSACPDLEWKSIISLVRYCGLMCPSEFSDLRWRDVDFARQQITVRSGVRNKRTIPLFDKAYVVLLDAHNEGISPDDFVVPTYRYRCENANCRQQLIRIIEKAGIRLWGKLFNSLRMSCEQQLRKEHDSELVAEWMGRRRQVVREFILQRMPTNQ